MARQKLVGDIRESHEVSSLSAIGEILDGQGIGAARKADVDSCAEDRGAMKKIFTFWEPRESMPEYIRLCLETWRRNLCDYEVEVLDYERLGEYLSSEEIESVLCREMSLAMQADCIRAALLKKHGGIWLDADTIAVKPMDAKLFNADVVMISSRREGVIVNYGAFIYAARENTAFMNEWHRQILPRVELAKKLYGSMARRICHPRQWKEVRKWNYVENAIIDPLATKAKAGEYATIDKALAYALPEEDLLVNGQAKNPLEAYRKYWLSDGEIDEIMERTMSIIMLHNSFMDDGYRKMSEQEFLATPTRLAKLLKCILRM